MAYVGRFFTEAVAYVPKALRAEFKFDRPSKIYAAMALPSTLGAFARAEKRLADDKAAGRVSSDAQLDLKAVVIYAANTKEYRGNATLDIDGDGQVTASDLEAKLERDARLDGKGKSNARLTAALAEVQSAENEVRKGETK